MFSFMRRTSLVMVACGSLIAATMLPASAAPITITAGSGDLPITEVVLDDNGTAVTQNSSQAGVSDSDNDPVDFVSVTVNDGGTSVTLDTFNVGVISTANYNFPSGLTGVTVYENGASTGVNTTGFEAAVDRVLNSTDLRDYLAYDALSQNGSGWNPDFDMLFTAPLRNSDYLLVSERLGNTFFDLVALDKEGNPILGGNVVGFDSPYRWNSGYAPSNQPTQPMWFSVIDIQQFGVDTEDFPIYGFRIDNDGEADVKFFGLSEDPFEPGMTLDKTVYAGHDLGVSCAGSELASVTTGADVTFCFTVTNTGEAVLDDLTITDTDLSLADAAVTDLTLVSGSLPLASGDSIVLAHEATATSTVTNTATASANVLLSGGGVNTVLSPETATDTARVEVTGLASISGSVVDEDGDPIEGVILTLSGAADDTTGTDSDGTYSFPDLFPGVYTVTETQPTGWGDGGETAGSEGGDVTDDQIANIDMAAGEVSIDNDFDEIGSSIAGSVVDQDNVGIEGVTLTLSGTDANAAAVDATVMTNASGDYLFDDLIGGTYTVTETQPVGYTDGPDSVGSTGGTLGNDVISDIALPAGVDSVDNDFSENVIVNPASISGIVVDDLGRPIAGVTVTLSGDASATTVTAADGTYSFPGLAPGTYTVTETQPIGYGDGGETPGSAGGVATDDVVSTIVLVAGQNSVDNDFAETTASIAGTVVDDAGKGIAGVTITLTGTDALGSPVSMTTTTDANGNYVFTGLLAGTYTVTESQPTGYDDGADSAGSTGGTVTNDVITAILIGPGVRSVDNDFAEILLAAVADDLANTGSETSLVIAFGLLFLVGGAVLTLVGSQVSGRRTLTI